jgi:TonB-linked SusC/RagA family outer membrane protein
MLSLNYYENKGTQIYTYFKRYSIRFNSEYNLIKNILTVGENFILSKENIVDMNQMDYMLKLPAILPVHLVDGTGWGGSAMSLGMDDYNNPVRILTQGKDDRDNYFKVLGSGFANLKLLKGLNFKTQYGIDFSSRYYRTLTHPYKEGGGKQSTITAVNGLASRSFTWTWTNTLNYHLETGQHQLDLLGGMEALRYYTESLSGNRQDILLEDYDYAYINSATGTQTIAGSGDEFSLLSYFAKFNYVFSSKYLLSATLRYDGSSKFGQNNRFGFFPAVSAGWRLSEESFLKNNELISDLKLRASWGMNGNSNIPTSALVNYYDANYAATAYGLLGNESGTLLSGYRRIHMGNPNLKWEGTKQTDIGLDFGLWNNRLSGSIDYFDKVTDGMLYEPGYLSAIGEGGAMWINAANMKNKGIELQLTYQSDPNKAFTYSISGNIGSYKNEINDLPSVVKFDYGGNGLGDDILGRPLNSLYGFVSDGLFKTQEEVNNSPEQPGKGIGRIRFKDLDHDGRITTQFDRTWIGVTDPDFTFGISTDAKYKHFDFAMFWQGIWGNTVRNDWKTYSDFWNVWTQNGFNHPTRLLDAWSPSNPNSTIPALSMSNPNDERRLSTYYMESGSYLKLRSIELGYTLPMNIASKAKMQNFRIFIQAQNIINLHKWWGENKYTGIDPENPSKAGEYSSPYVIPQFFKTGISASF